MLKINKLNNSLQINLWEDFLTKNLNNPLLEKAKYLPEYFRTYGKAQLVAVIQALDNEPRAHTYYSVPTLDETMNQRLSPAFLFDNSELISLHKEKLFELDINKQPDYLKSQLFVFDSEASSLYVYNKKGYTPSVLLEDMRQHIIENPYAIIFKGCDDGHVGKRFNSRQEADKFLSNLQFFDDVFDNQDKDMVKTILKLKKETPHENISQLFHGRLEYHN